MFLPLLWIHTVLDDVLQKGNNESAFKNKAIKITDMIEMTIFCLSFFSNNALNNECHGLRSFIYKQSL